MESERKNSKIIGKIFGCIMTFLVFTFILFFILSRKIQNFNFLYTITFSLLITLFGLIINKTLK